MRPTDVQATFCATVVDQFVRLGLRHAVVAPGSRSTPMALALAERPDLEVHIAHDERTAAFIALGIGASTGMPATLLCTSGTAATHFHAAVVEADLAGVPMLVLTADRPPELHGIGAPQTIDQQELFGGAVRMFSDAGVADAAASDTWRAVATGWWLASTGVAAGPVHVNLPFREPLVGVVGELPPVEDVIDESDEGWFLAPLSAEEFLTLLDGRRGVIVAGRGIDRVDAVDALATSLGWPVLADPRSGCRELDAAVCAFDPLLRVEKFAVAHMPEVVVHLGDPPASKVLGQWLAGSGAVHVQVHPQHRVLDPLGIIDHRVFGEVGVWCDALRSETSWPPRPAPAGWSAEWQHAERAAQGALGAILDDDDAFLTEPAVARVLSSGNAELVVSSSMPVRDVEWFGAPASTTVHSNRGANGIDGVLATAIGVALGTARPTVAFVGDVAFCHDQSSLTALARRRVDLKIIVVDNDGGGIFSFLPQAGSLPPARFEELFGTPHGTDVLAVAAGHGLATRDVATRRELVAALAEPGLAVVRVRSDRAANVAEHRRLEQCVSDAIT
ncbi:MAG: 2-succinyl-5-enolpyruvyl-6-hydroxy-3-cyclohexene-1-carboxylic-acid synthase [Ilumatobacteraceae bacterium]